jgi:XTP/dITP diphosphohydrolase
VRRLLLATTNHGKQDELRRLLVGLPADVVAPQEIGLDLHVPEPYDSYAENARAKADAYARTSGLLTLADDSGIEVAALDWGPGVRSARYAADGIDAADLVLRQLEGAADRRARMVCVLALGIPSGGADGAAAIELFSGTVQGAVATSRRGSGGFGYDPIFELPDGRTTAELPEADKDRVSHRGQAVAAATPRLTELLSAD